MGHITEGFEAALIATIKAEMAARGLTQAELAAEIEISREAMGRYLRGTRVIPTDVYFRMGEAFGFGPSELMARAEKRANQ